MTQKAKLAQTIIENLIDGESGITHFYTDKPYPAADDHDRWRIEIKTSDGAWLTLIMEGINVATLYQCSVPGQVLIGRENQLAVLTAITSDRLRMLDDLVHAAHSQIAPN